MQVHSKGASVPHPVTSACRLLGPPLCRGLEFSHFRLHPKLPCPAAPREPHLQGSGAVGPRAAGRPKRLPWPDAPPARLRRCMAGPAKWLRGGAFGGKSFASLAENTRGERGGGGDNRSCSVIHPWYPWVSMPSHDPWFSIYSLSTDLKTANTPILSQPPIRLQGRARGVRRYGHAAHGVVVVQAPAPQQQNNPRSWELVPCPWPRFTHGERVPGNRIFGRGGWVFVRVLFFLGRVVLHGVFERICFWAGLG